MAKIPVYQREQSMVAPMNVARATSAVSPNSPVAAALGNLAQTGNQVVAMMGREQAIEAREAKQEQEEAAAADVSNVLSNAELTWTKRTSELFGEFKPDAGGDLSKTVGTEFDAWASQQAEKMPTDKSRRYFETSTAKMKARLQVGAFEHQKAATEALRTAKTTVGMAEDEQVVFADPTKFDEVFTRRTEPMIATSTDHAKTTIAVAKYRVGLSLAKERGEMKADPKAWYAARFGALPGQGGAAAGGAAPVGFDNVVQQILKTEGGYAAADGNSGAPVNFGINQGANPGVDVKTLTKDGAIAIYKDKYWDAIGGDKLPPSLQATAMDAAVNQGQGNAKKWIEESGGDVTKFNALRREHYENLLAKPEYARFRSAWMGRLAKYEKGTPATAPASPATPGAPPAEPVAATQPPKSFLTLPPEVQLDMQKQALSAIEHETARAIAGISVAAARETVAAVDLQADAVIDIPKAKAEAVAKATAAAGSLSEPQRLAVESAVEAAAGDKERDRKRAEETDVQAGFDALDKSGGDIIAYQRDNQEVLARMGRGAKDRLQKYAGEVATGLTRTTDWTAYKEFIENPAALKAANLPAVRDKFNAAEFAQLVKMQDGLTNGAPEDNIRTNLVLVKDMLKEAKITDDKKETKFFSMLQQAIDQELLATGKKALKQSEVKALADDLLVKQITSRGVLWDSEERSFNIAVPPVERTKIEAALSSAGLPVSDYEIMRQYRKKLEAKSVLQKQKQTEKK